MAAGLHLLHRLLLMAVTLLGLVCITFLVSNIAPADPAALAAGPDATPDMVQTVRSEYGLDLPLPQQFAHYLTDLAQGRLGRSVATGRSVAADLARFLPATLELVVVAMAIGIALGVPLGVVAAARRSSWVDAAVQFAGVSGIALPAFWLGLVAQLVLSVWLHWLPTSGRLDVGIIPPPTVTGALLLDSLVAGQAPTFVNALQHMVMPAVILAAPCIAAILRVTRAEMIEALGSDYVLAARANGVASGTILGVLALRNALLPVLAMIGLRFGWMLGGTVLVETVFDWPGIGLYAVSSAAASDFRPVMGVTLVVGISFTLVNFFVDVAYTSMDPRLRRT